MEKGLTVVSDYAQMIHAPNICGQKCLVVAKRFNT
jgi:hypothetical protein